MQRAHRPSRKDSRNAEILKRALSGETHASIAISYGVTPGRIQQIVQKERKWAQNGYKPLLERSN